jgi:hypothetical protein
VNAERVISVICDCCGSEGVCTNCKLFDFMCSEIIETGHSVEIKTKYICRNCGNPIISRTALCEDNEEE